MRTSKQYAESLRDGRTVYYRGEKVADVTQHPVIAKAIAHAAIVFDVAADAELGNLASVDEDGNSYSRYYKLPRSVDDLQLRSRLIEATTARAKTLFPAVKEAGSDAIFGLLRTTADIDRTHETEYHARAERFYRHCRDNDLALSIVQTDVKGDRTLGPSQQPDPDRYLHIVERREDGIVVRGAKMHTSCTPNVNELVVLPTRAMGEADAEYAVAFALSADTPGLKIVTSPYGGSPRREFDHPLSADRKMLETITIFDDVFVPWERVFMAGEYTFAGPLALAFVDYHRFTAISYKLPLVDALVGSAALMAQINGISRAAHVRDKLTWLISYAETVRALTELAALRAQPDSSGLYVADALTTNMAKYHFAHNFHQALMHVQDIAGGMLVTGPAVEDFENPKTGPLLRKYLGGAAGFDGEVRTRAMNMVSDLTAGDFGGYHTILAMHAEGSLEAEKLMILRAYDSRRTLAYARALAGIDGNPS